jgi:Peptidase A4 family
MPSSLFPSAPSSISAQLESTSTDWVVPTCTALQNVQTDLPQISASDSGVYEGRTQSDNWSGYMVQPDTAGHTYTDAYAVWTVPSVVSSDGDDQYTSAWVGLGSGQGTESSGQQYLLDQAGTTQSVIGGQGKYAFFWELFPENASQTKTPTGMTLPALSPGNSVYVEVDHTGGGTTEYVLYNETTGKSTAFSATWDQGAYVEGGGQAEWIMERPEVGAYYSELANYDSFTFREMTVTNNVGGVYYPGELDRQQYYMTNCVLTQTLSNPADLVDGSTPNNSGTITWEASGTGGWTPKACEDAG